MNNLLVAKFGGTSMADWTAMNRSADIIEANRDVRLVVVSACAGVTNQLVALSRPRVSARERQLILQSIRSHHEQLLAQITNCEAAQTTLHQTILFLAAAAERLSDQYHLRGVDEVLSFGELLSSQLLVELLNRRGHLCEWFDARLVMVTDSRYGAAIPQVDQIATQARARLLPLCQQKLVVTQGFIGSDSERRTTTLGRGGSDYSAALLAEGLEAAGLQIWTDVEGIYTTDPRVVPQAQPLPELGFCEAAELATFGAKVLHPSTLWPAIRSEIDVFVGSSLNPDAQGTRICKAVSEAPAYRAVALRREQTLVTVSSLDMLHSHGFLAKVFGLLARHEISVDLVTTSEVSIALTLDSIGTVAHGLNEQVLTELRQIGEVKVEEGLALIAVVGNEIERQTGASARIFSALSPYNLRLICHGASGHNICFLVDQVQANDVVSSLHRELFEGEVSC